MPERDAASRRLRWSFEDLPYDQVDRAAVADNRLLFYILTTASFVEIMSDLYTRNLAEYYDDDEEVCDWLTHGWEPEELQHGKALRRYVMTVWPEFDWDDAFAKFSRDYATYCNAEALGPTRALELARRCIVETGTCSYYSMVRNFSPCPVLTELASNIRTDEAGHYRHFYDYFKRYSQAESPSRAALLKTLVSRIREIDGEDGFIAYQHAWQGMNPDRTFQKRYYRDFSRAVRTMAADYYPFRMAVHMATQPLGMSFKAQRRTDRIVATTARAAARFGGKRRAAVGSQ